VSALAKVGTAFKLWNEKEDIAKKTAKKRGKDMALPLYIFGYLRFKDQELRLSI
jgi:hypothetical protein